MHWFFVNIIEPEKANLFDELVHIIKLPDPNYNNNSLTKKM